MTGIAIALLTFVLTSAMSEAHKNAKERSDALFILFADALRTIKQLDHWQRRLDDVAAYLASTTNPARAKVPAYFALDPTSLSSDLAQSLELGESAVALRYLAEWKSLAALLQRYEKQYDRLYLSETKTPGDDAIELGGTTANAAGVAAALKFAALELCGRWFASGYILAGHLPDPRGDSDGRWTSSEAFDAELDAYFTELDARVVARAAKALTAAST